MQAGANHVRRIRKKQFDTPYANSGMTGPDPPLTSPFLKAHPLPSHDHNS